MNKENKEHGIKKYLKIKKKEEWRNITLHLKSS